MDAFRFASPLKRRAAALVAALLVLALASPAATAQDRIRDGAPDDVLIQNATVLTVTNGTLESTDVLVEDGVIAEIGQDLSAGRDVPTVDASGQYLMPGIIDAHSHIAISSVNEATSPVTAEVGVGDVLDPYDIALYRALAGGVTTSHVMHGSANAIGGRNETIKHRYGVTTPEALRFEGAPRTIKFALGENPTRVHGQGRGIPPRTRMGVEQVIRDALAEAERYAAHKAAYENGDRPAPPPHSERMEVLAGVLSGDVEVHCHSYRADEILMLMRVLEDFGVEHITFQHVNEGFKIAPELAAFGAGASIFSDWWAYKFEVYYSTAFNAAILTENGVTTSINSDSGELNRHLYHEAAKSQRYGELTDDQALALITINPARQLGIDDRVGSIEEGKDADLALFSAHPLSVYAIPQQTYVDGVLRFDIDADADDMRLAVDPEAAVDATADRLDVHHDEDRCMQGAFGGQRYLQATQEGLFLRD
jgi:imidazolonepropionase-like amidohydrolase